MSNSNLTLAFSCSHLLKGGLPSRRVLWAPQAHTDRHNLRCSAHPHSNLAARAPFPPCSFDQLQSPSSQQYYEDKAKQLLFWVRALSFLPTALTPNIWKITHLLLFTITPPMSHLFTFIFIHQNKVNSSLPIFEEQGVRLIIKIHLKSRWNQLI